MWFRVESRHYSPICWFNAAWISVVRCCCFLPSLSELGGEVNGSVRVRHQTWTHYTTALSEIVASNGITSLNLRYPVHSQIRVARQHNLQAAVLSRDVAYAQRPTSSPPSCRIGSRSEGRFSDKLSAEQLFHSPFQFIFVSYNLFRDTMDHEKISDFLGEQRDKAPEDLAHYFLSFENYWERKLWHELTDILVKYYSEPQSVGQRIAIYNSFIKTFADKINQLKLVQIGLSTASQYKGMQGI